MMSISADTLIAGKKTVGDWHAFKPNLLNGTADTWKSAYKDFFVARLAFRYMTPIQVLQENDTYQGEGFSILAIQCSLIEFLESTAQGLIYCPVSKGMQLGQYEYSKSKNIFLSFLCNRAPFSETFDAASAMDFYTNVRCGLLHEARTKGEWKIRTDLPKGVLIDAANKIVDRNNFQVALLDYIHSYGVAIQSEKTLQEAFIRKFDSLCV